MNLVRNLGRNWKRTILGFGVVASAIIGGQALSAGYGVMPQESTFRKLAEYAPVVVKARLLEVVDSPFISTNNDQNADVLLYRYNNGDENVRRDAKIEVTSVLQGDVQPGVMEIVSMMQMKLEQYPAELRSGQEAVFYLTKRAFDGRWEVLGEARGLLDPASSGGSIEDAEMTVQHVISINTQHAGNVAARRAAMQDQLMNTLRFTSGRLANDALIEFGYNWDEFQAYFSSTEKQELLDLLLESPAGSEYRRNLLVAIGRIKPAGAEPTIVNMIATDESPRIATIGSWALEQYGRGAGANLLLNRLMSTARSNVTSRARVIQALGIMRPKANRTDEASARVRFTDVLRDSLSATEDANVRREALLAARDMRLTEGELDGALRQVMVDFSNELVSEEDFKRAIVALAATRRTDNHNYLKSIRGTFGGRFDEHINLCLTTSPFAVLVNGQ